MADVIKLQLLRVSGAMCVCRRLTGETNCENPEECGTGTLVVTSRASRRVARSNWLETGEGDQSEATCRDVSPSRHLAWVYPSTTGPATFFK